MWAFWWELGFLPAKICCNTFWVSDNYAEYLPIRYELLCSLRDERRFHGIGAFALIFNTAFSLYYATARRFAGDDVRKMHRYIIGIVILGYICSFGGFTKLVSWMYPLLGYMGFLVLAVLSIAWIQERDNIIREKFLRRKMIRLLFRKYDDDYEFTRQNKQTFQKLGEMSAADTEGLKKDIKAYVEDVVENHDDLQTYAKKNLSMEGSPLKKEKKE